MESKTLIYKCLIYFLLSFLLLIFIISYFKERSFETISSSLKIEATKKYDKQYKELVQTADFIYFNEFIKDKKLILFFQKNSLSSLKEKLYDEFEKEFTYYKTLGLDNVYFFSSSADDILNFQDINFQDTFNKTIANKVIQTKKERVDIKIVNQNSYILFSKPIIDENLELVGVVNFEFNFNKILEELNSNSSLVFEQIVLENSENIDKKAIYIPVHNFTDEKTLYLKSSPLQNSDEVIKSNDFYRFLTIIFSINLVVIIFLLNRARVQKYRQNLIQNSYDELFSQVDDYVLKLDTDLRGNITFVTKYFSKVSGYSKDEIIGKNANILRHPDMSQNFYKNLWSN